MRKRICLYSPVGYGESETLNPCVYQNTTIMSFENFLTPKTSLRKVLEKNMALESVFIHVNIIAGYFASAIWDFLTWQRIVH